MEFDMAGLLVKKKFNNDQEVEKLLDTEIKFLKVVGFEEATSSFRSENAVDILEAAHGTFVLTGLGQLDDLSEIENDASQFMVSDVSDTYYFEKYSNEKLERKFINSQGEVVENIGDGIINKNDDLMNKICHFANEYLQNDFVKTMFDLKFKRY